MSRQLLVILGNLLLAQIFNCPSLQLSLHHAWPPTPAQQAACKQPLLNACTDTFLKFVDFNTTNYDLWKNYTTLYNFFTTKMSSDVGKADGLVNICNGLDNFLSCAGNCFNPQALTAMKYPLDNAFKVLGMLNQFNFECGAGFFTSMIENFSCIQRVLKHNKDLLSKCQNTYFTNIAHGDPGKECEYSAHLAFCYMMPFDRAQCHNTQRADKWWACESQVAFTRPQFPNCKFDCSDFFDHRSNQQDAHQVYMETHYKKTETGHMYKMADTFAEINGKWKEVEGQWVHVGEMV